MRATKIAGLGLQGLRRNPLRVTLTTLGVTIASGAMVSMMALALGIQIQLEIPFRALNLLNDIQVKPKDDDKKDAAVLDDAVLDRFEGIPGVAVAYPDVHIKGVTIVRGEKHESVIAVAMPREASLLGVTEEIVVAGRFLSEGSASEGILGRQLVAALGFASPKEAIGAEVTLEAAGLTAETENTFAYRQKKLKVTIVGVYEAPPLLPALAQRGIILPVDLMKQVPGINVESALNRLKAGGTGPAGYSAAMVHVRDPATLAGIEKRIQAMGFKTQTILSKLEGMERVFIAIKLLLIVVGSVAMAIASLGIINTLLMSVLERYQEIGICKAVGASDGDLFVLFLTEAAVIGFLGGLSGLALGWAISMGLEFTATTYAHTQGFVGRLELFAFSPWLLMATVAFAVFVSVIAGIYPALRAARVDPIRALRSH